MLKKHRSKMKFYNQCVQYVKKCSNGYIHPSDTSWKSLAFAFEYLLKLEHTKEAYYERCVSLAGHFAIKLPKVYRIALCKDSRKHFYSSVAWKKLRYAALVKHGGRCQCCGASGKEVPIRVDHIKPISIYWDLRLDENNVQVLCNDCNWGKLNLDETDWR